MVVLDSWNGPWKLLSLIEGGGTPTLSVVAGGSISWGRVIPPPRDTFSVPLTQAAGGQPANAAEPVWGLPLARRVLHLLVHNVGALISYDFVLSLSRLRKNRG